MTLLLRAGRLLLGAAVAAAATPACYSAGGGTAPPTSTFYFPTGLAVSTGGNVLYAINSDFDLQWNGGTLQSYNLFLIRQHAAQLIQANLSGAQALPAPIANHQIGSEWVPGHCPGSAPPPTSGTGIGVPIGEACAPPIDSTFYVRDSAIVGAFATDLELALTGDRLFSPLSGATAVTWADIAVDDPKTAPVEDTAQDQETQPFAPFAIDCGTRVDGRCDAEHQTGNDPNSYANTRHVTMPGEPFGMAQSQDGTALLVTSQTDTKTSLLTTGLSVHQAALPVPADADAGVGVDDQGRPAPTMQFVLDGLPTGGVGIATIPHEPGGVAAAGYNRCEDFPNVPAAMRPPCVRPAFLQTSRNAAEIDLIRYYDDDGSTQHRPFIQKEAVFPLSLQSGGADFRGIAIDPTPRFQCAATATTPAAKLACAQLPARVFVASRTPPALVIGEVGQPTGTDNTTYDPDRLVITGLVPMLAGPSKVFLAPIVDKNGNYALRVFVVCFDSNAIYVYDPQAEAFETMISTGVGPFAMAFDPFDWNDVAQNKPVQIDPRQDPALALKTYRFAYVASFTQSYVQVIDLDQSAPSQQTFEKIVYTLGKPTPPKGT